MRNARVKKGGFSFLSFLLGILFGIILLLGAVGGAVAFVLFTDLDKVFEVTDIKNKDEEGNYILINTDPDNGGVKTVLDLFSKVTGIAGDYGSYSLGEIEDIVPAIKQFSDGIRDSLSEYVEIDMTELRAQKFSQIGEYIENVIYDIKPASILSKSSIDPDEGVTGAIFTAIMYGKESEYVEYGGVLYPVWFEEVETATLSAREGEPAEPAKIYFYNRNELWFIAQKTEDGYLATGEIYTRYNAEKAQLSGNYYYNNGDDTGEKVIYKDVTLRDFTNDDSMSGVMDGLEICDLLKVEEGVVYDILGGVSVGDVIAGEVDFDEKIKTLEITSILDIDPESTIMAYLGYGLSGVTAADGAAYNYTASLDGETVYITAENNVITGVYSDAALTSEIKGTTVNGIGGKVDGVTVDVFMDIKPDDAVLAYLGYGLKGVESTGDGYSGKVDIEGVEKACVVVTDGEGENEKITRVYYVEGGEEVEVKATNIDGISDRVSNITEVIELTDFLDVEPDGAVMMYIGYGVTGTTAVVGEDNTYTAKYKPEGATDEITVTVKSKLNDEEKEVVDSVYYIEGGETIYIKGASVDEVSDRMNGLTKELKIKDIVEIKEGDKIMKKLGEYTIENAGDAIDAFALDDFMDDVEPDDALMTYLVYNVTDVELINGVYTGVYAKDTPDEATVYIQTAQDADDNTKTVIAGVYASSDFSAASAIEATKVNAVSQRISGLTDTLTIGDVIDVDDTSSKFLVKIADLKISEVGTATEILTLDDFIEVELKVGGDGSLTSDTAILAYVVFGINEVDTAAKTATYTVINPAAGQPETVEVTYETNAAGVITAVNAVEAQYAGLVVPTGVTDVGARVAGVTDDLTIGELLNVTGNRFLENLSGSTINSLADDISALTIQQIYSDKVYGEDAELKVAVAAENPAAGEIKFMPEYLYFVKDEAGKVSLYNGDGKATALVPGTTLYTYGKTTDLWRILLYENNVSEKAYSVNNIANMVDNVTGNVSGSSLRQLCNAKILVLDENTLTMKIQYGGAKTEFGKLTLTQAIDTLAKMLAAPQP